MSTPAPKRPATPAAAPAASTTPAAVEDDFDKEFERLGAAERGEAADDQPDPEATPATPAGQNKAATPADNDDQPDPPQQQTAQDLWANLTPEQKAELGRLNEKLATTEHQARTDAGRVAALNRELENARKAGKPVPTTAAAQPSQALAAAALAGDPNALKTLKEDYPVIAKVVEDMAARTAQAINATEERVRKDLEARVSPLLSRMTQDDEARQLSYVQQQAAALTDAHPDWQTVKATKDFNTWVGQQPPGVQKMLDSMDARDAIHVMDLYKGAGTGQDDAELTARRAQRRQQAAAVPGMSGRAAQQSRTQQIPDNFDAAWDVLAQQEAARAKR